MKPGDLISTATDLFERHAALIAATRDEYSGCGGFDKDRRVGS